MENKTGKPALPAGRYFKYAIGEIILVVIGILIALQINNWNERQKIKLEEEKLVSGLIQNIDEDIKNLIDLKKRDSTFIVANKILLSAFKHDSIRNNKSLLSANIYSSFFSGSLTPTRTIFKQMQFSGKLNYILSDSLRNNIQSYYDKVNSVLETQESNRKLIFELNIDLATFVDGNSAFQFILPEFAKMELDEFDNSFFYEPLKSNKVKEFANFLTGKQTLMFTIYNAHNSLLQSGMKLKQNLIEYLDSK